VLVPINVRLTAGEDRYILGHSGAKFLFGGLRVRQLGPSHNWESGRIKKGVDILDSRGAKPLVRWITRLPGQRRPQACALFVAGRRGCSSCLNYTSGTTGKPKGVMITHRGAYLTALGRLVGGELTPAQNISGPCHVPLQRLVLCVGVTAGGRYSHLPPQI